jgi:hypothetical protein
MSLWTAYTVYNGANILYQVALNPTTNTESKHALKFLIKVVTQIQKD